MKLSRPPLLEVMLSLVLWRRDKRLRPPLSTMPDLVGLHFSVSSSELPVRPTH